MSRLSIELEVRALRARMGMQLRRGLPATGMLRGAVMDLERRTPHVDQAYLQERLLALLKDWRISLLVRANPWLILPRDFYRMPAPLAGPALLGNVIVTGDGRVARIAEVVTRDSAPCPLSIASMRESHAAMPGRLCLHEEDGVMLASVLCGSSFDMSLITLSAIEPLEGVATIMGQCGLPGDGACTLHGGAVVRSLGLEARHHGMDLALRSSAVRIASTLRRTPLTRGRRVDAASLRPRWRWALPRVQHRP